ncbi:MAG: alpha/beta hydrolase [Bacteroidales bacterium]|nr:alpha/beta hydrolase [Bacteroidales bacterium]
MNKSKTVLITLICTIALVQFVDARNISYVPDSYCKGFLSTTIEQPDDYEGKVVTTLVKKTRDGNENAVLYIHGYSDYFFQTEMADQYLNQGINFYAIDLRKYGRSHLPHQWFNEARDLSEYYADIDTALSIIQSEIKGKILLSGHSTGGLIAACYADDRGDNGKFQALFLNSPFFDMNYGFLIETIVEPLIVSKGKRKPTKPLEGSGLSLYWESIHKDYYGEWDFDLKLKPRKAPPVNCGWIRAIHNGHKKVQKGLNIPVPVLVMHSDNSVYGKKWKEDFYYGDAVLDVKDINKFSQNIGSKVEIKIIEKGMHDLVLSRKEIRHEVYNQLFDWTSTVFK